MNIWDSLIGGINSAVGNDPNDGTNALMRFGQAMQGNQPAAQNTPAALQVTNEYLKALKTGDIARANAIQMFAKTLDKGVVLDPTGQATVLPGYAPAVGSIAATKAGMSQEAEKNVDLRMNPQIAGAEAGARADVDIRTAADIAKEKARGAEVGAAEGAKDKKTIQAPDINTLIKEAETILPQSTSGLAGAAMTGASKMVGRSTDASKADARLKVLSAALTSTVPRFEGPQGVLDVELYKQAAADVANTSLPYQDRLAALDTMKTLNQRYMPEGGLNSETGSPVDLPGASDQGMSEMPPAAQHTGRTITDTTTGKKYKSNGKEWVPL